MIRALLRRYVHDARWLLFGCGLALFAFCWMRVWLVSRLDTSRFKAILDLLPSDWRRFSPVDFDWLVTYAGRIALAYDELIVVMCVSIWAIARGSDAVSGELNRGTLEMLLAQPVSRLKLLLTQAGVTIAGVAVLAGLTWLGTWVGIQTTTVKEEFRPTWKLPIELPLLGREIPVPFSEKQTRLVPMTEKVESHVFWPGAANLFSLGFMLAGVTTFLSSWDRYRWRTIGIVCAAYVVELMLKLAGLASDDLAWLLYLSVFTAYEPEVFVNLATTEPELAWSLVRFEPDGAWKSLGPLGYDLTLVLLGLAGYVAAGVIFCRRDLPAPL